jgi:hypothetical protein
MKEKTPKIELTPEQKEQVQKATGKDVPELKLMVEELEARVAPAVFGPKLPKTSGD